MFLKYPHQLVSSCWNVNTRVRLDSCVTFPVGKLEVDFNSGCSVCGSDLYDCVKVVLMRVFNPRWLGCHRFPNLTYTHKVTCLVAVVADLFICWAMYMACTCGLDPRPGYATCCWVVAAFVAWLPKQLQERHWSMPWCFQRAFFLAFEWRVAFSPYL